MMYKQQLIVLLVISALLASKTAQALDFRQLMSAIPDASEQYDKN